jgi:mannose-P-dolichol utilization defect protein 1
VLTCLISASLLIIPRSLLPLLQLSTLPISLFSKIPQIASNVRARSTGNLSAIAVGAQIAGCAARLFTTATELEGDAYVLWGFVLALILNGVIGFQMWMYWGKDTVDEKKKEPVVLPAREYPREKVGNPIVQTQRLSPAPHARAGSAPPVNPSAAGNRRWTRKID